MLPGPLYPPSIPTPSILFRPSGLDFGIIPELLERFV